MARAESNLNDEILEYALKHLEKERDEIQLRIDGIRRQLSSRTATVPRAAKKTNTAPAKRVLSEAARRRIAAAQKKRWAEHRKRAAAGQ
jgi:hypothetical protein